MKTRKWIVLAAAAMLVILVAAFLAPPASAGETRTGGTVEIKEGETITDDLYVFAETVLVNGTVQGDLISFSTKLVLGPTGVIEGDLMGAGQSLEIQGVVNDDARMAGAVLTLGDSAQIGDDLLAAGYSLETNSGSQVGGSLTFAGFQAQLAGSVEEDLVFAGNSLDLQGSVGGNAYIEVGEARQTLPINPFTFIPNMPPVPSVPPGLNISDDASIAGSLTYQAPKEAEIPAGTVAGETEFTQIVEPTRVPEGEPEGEPEVRVEPRPSQPSPFAAVTQWGKALLRNLMSLLIVGLLVAGLYPRLLSGSGDTLKIRPWASLGVGILTGIVFWLVMPVLAMILFGVVVLFGLFSVGGLFIPALLVMLLILLVLVLAFLISGSYFSKLIICQVLGSLILGGLKSPAANHRFAPWLIGLVIFILVSSIPYVGWIANILAVFFGLGAFVLWVFGLRKASLQPTAEPLVPLNTSEPG
jgi:cytoskeletal protein CcmA (bactofilin family)